MAAGLASPGLLVKRSPISAFLVGRHALLELRRLRNGPAIAADVVPCGALSRSGAVGRTGAVGT
jgi:hypothetical protein